MAVSERALRARVDRSGASSSAPPADESSTPKRVRTTRKAIEAHTSRRARAVAVLGAVVIGGALFIVVAGQALVASQQVRIDNLRTDLSTSVNANENLGLSRAQLEAPGRILVLAQRDLHMVVPKKVTYLNPVNPGPPISSADNADDHAGGVDCGAKLKPNVAQHRLRIISLGIGLAVVCLIGRLAIVQVLNGAKYANYQTSETEQRVVLPALRGAIYDRSGALLAASVPRYDVIADDLLIDNPNTIATELASKLHVGTGTLFGELSKKSGYVVIAHQVTGSTENAIAAYGIDGISFSTDDARVTSGGSLFQPLLGSVNAAGHGDAALEYAFDGLLSGAPGSQVEAEAPGGLVLPGGAHSIVSPHLGTSLVLSVDEALQVEVTKDLTAEMQATHSDSGVAVISQVHSGAILAMVDLVRTPKGAIVPAPLNNAVASIYQPGSVMKLATISFALQNGLISPNTVFTVPYSISVGGYTFQDADYHPTQQMTVAQILAQSSNVGTIEISRLLGMQRLAQALRAFGFGSLTGLNWPGESPGIVGTAASWYGSAAASVPIGTGIAVTPMQILDAYNSVANGGVFVPPRVVAGTITGNNPERVVPPSTTRPVLNSSTVRQLVPMLEGVVQDGTAVLADIPGYTVAGKTGTAQVPSSTGLGYVPGDWNATFVGFVPAESPQLSGIVVLNHPTPIYGGTVSAPVFAQIMQYALRHYDIAPPQPTSPQTPVSTATSASSSTASATTIATASPSGAPTSR